jgi:hypothetical protein
MTDVLRQDDAAHKHNSYRVFGLGGPLLGVRVRARLKWFQEVKMIKKLTMALGACWFIGAGLAAAPAANASEPTYDDRREIACSIITRHDRDRDGRLNISEARRAGKAAFKELNKDRDFTLEHSEIADRIDAETFDKYNRVKRRGLDRGEWNRLVKDRFRAATEGARTIGCDQLFSPDGRRLLAVIWY